MGSRFEPWHVHRYMVEKKTSKVSDNERPRAIIRGNTLPEQNKIYGMLFIGEHVDYYVSELKKSLPPTIVIATSIRDCYEIALQRPSLYVGKEADRFMERDLVESGFRPEIVTPVQFDSLCKDKSKL